MRTADTLLGRAGWAVALLLAFALAWRTTGERSDVQTSWLEVAVPTGMRFAGGGLDISPSGSALVFSAVGDSGGAPQLYTRAIDELTPTPIPGTTGGVKPRFSPDGSTIAFVMDEALKVVALDGTPPMTIVPDSVFSVSGIHWGTDGMIYFGKLDENGLWRVREGGGPPERLSGLAGTVRHPELLPGGRVILASILAAEGGAMTTGRPAQIVSYSLEDGETTTLVEGMVARYARSGHLMYTSPDRAGTLVAAPFDLDCTCVTGAARTITQGLSVDVNAASHLAVSESGSLFFQLGGSGPGEGVVVWLRRDGSEEIVNPALNGVIETPVLSPDGQLIAFDRIDDGHRNVHLYDSSARTFRRLTPEGGTNLRPEWSPDGTQLGFVSVREGRQAFYAVAVDSSVAPRLLRSPNDGAIIWEGAWSTDMRWLLYRELPRPGVAHLMFASPSPDADPRVLVGTEYFNAHVSVSPEGDWVAYYSDESGHDAVYVRRFPGPSGPITVSDERGGHSPVWAANGQIFYVSGTEWVVATVEAVPTFRVLGRERFASTVGYYTATTIQRYDVSADGERILAVRDLSRGETRAVLVQNFFEELRAVRP